MILYHYTDVAYLSLCRVDTRASGSQEGLDRRQQQQKHAFPGPQTGHPCARGHGVWLSIAGVKVRGLSLTEEWCKFGKSPFQGRSDVELLLPPGHLFFHFDLRCHYNIKLLSQGFERYF